MDNAVMIVREGCFDSDARIDQAIAESFPASDAPSWNSGVDKAAVVFVNAGAIPTINR